MFNKIYKDKNKFYGISNNFNFKITISCDNYRQVKLPLNAYIYGVFIMLFGLA